MATIGTIVFVSAISRPFLHPPITSSSAIATSTYKSKRDNGSFWKNKKLIRLNMEEPKVKNHSSSFSLKKDYLEQSIQLMQSTSSDNGPPRWFSPLDCAPVPLKHSTCPGPVLPLLLFLPGIDGVGLGLVLHHKALAETFRVWCLHIPSTDRTPFTELLILIEERVRSEYKSNPNRPIYLVGESLGGCLALAIAARNQNIDLLLILSNPATCFHKSQMQSLLPLSQHMPDHMPHIFSSITGFPTWMIIAMVENELPLHLLIEELPKDASALLYYVSVMAHTLSVKTLAWKLEMLKSAAEYANSRLHAVKIDALILSSGNDLFLPSKKEGKRLRHILPKSEVRILSQRGHALFLEDDFDLVNLINSARFYRRGKSIDYISDYLRPSIFQFKHMYDPFRIMELVSDPVMLSTLKNGEILRSLDGVPSEGPVLFVGYHMLVGLELPGLISRFWSERNILIRGVAHPMMFYRLKYGRLPDLSCYDIFRFMGAVPVSPTNLFKLFSSKSHVLLYPGGMREALHRKGEEYKLFWPESSEFVRMAARFGTKIIPFSVVGEEDLVRLLLDYDDLIKVPYFKAAIEELTEEAVPVTMRTESVGEVSNQQAHVPIVVPKIPGRLYYLFGKPIETEGRKEELRSKEKADEMYMEVKRTIEEGICYLKEKREKDPYRSILSRLLYQATHAGFYTQVPTFPMN